MLLDDIGKVLEDAGVGVVQTDLFLGTMPSEPATCLAVHETVGLGMLEAYGPGPLDYAIERPSVQVVARNKDYEQARLKAQSAYVALHGFHGMVNGIRYVAIQAQQPPFKIGVDENSLHLVGFNANILKAPQ